MNTKLLIAAVLLSAAAGWTAAQETVPCKADVEKFCKDVKPGKGRIGACLKEHETELSPDCKGEKQVQGNEDA